MNSLSSGETSICNWKDNKIAAYSIGGDDSLRSQLFFAIPEMDKRGIRGTWWVNPGRGGPVNYKNQDDAWAECWIACYDQWKAAAARGHDFGNHTLHHLGAATVAEAEQEIGQSAAAIWEANPRQRLQLFLKGGGTIWGISDQQIADILLKYDCVRGRGGGIEDLTWEINPSPALLKSFIDTAIQEGSWHLVGFHGIGPNCEWGGPVDGDAFIAMLDYLVEKRDQVWAGSHTEVHKYVQERSQAKVNLQQVTKQSICLTLTSNKDPHLYDFPLTLRTIVLSGWERVQVSQDGTTSLIEVMAGVAQYNALPNHGDISIQPR